MTIPDVVFLFDVDNTLLNNDHVQKDLRRHLETELGAESRDRYFGILEELRSELGYAAYLGALQRYRLVPTPDHGRLRRTVNYLLNLIIKKYGSSPN